MSLQTQPSPTQPLPELLSPTDLQAYIQAHQIDAHLVQNIGETPTVPAAAAALGVAPERIIKTLLFLVKRSNDPAIAREPVVVISNGEKHVDKKLIADHCGVGKKKISMASAEVVLALLGYPAGGVPPLGHRTELTTLLDPSVLELQHSEGGLIYGGGGDDRTMLKLTVSELIRVTQP